MTRPAHIAAGTSLEGPMGKASEKTANREAKLNEIIAGYLTALEAGQVPNRAELLTQHPELAAELRSFFADHDQVQQIADPMRPAVATVGAVTPNPVAANEA